LRLPYALLTARRNFTKVVQQTDIPVVAEIDGEELEGAPGDFMAFPTPAVPHHLKSPFDQELVYLMGGENWQFEIAEFPRLGKRMAKSGETFDVYDMSNAKPFGPLDT
jgi:uncharacterized cupin superfamily protein